MSDALAFLAAASQRRLAALACPAEAARHKGQARH